jgi:hypothetical protein
MIVILSTLNGNGRLREMLDAMLRVRIPGGTRIHVVDNGSDDGTVELLNSYAARLPLVIYEQPIRGKNHCVNLVLDTVSANLDPVELVVLTDDDILPSPEWLEELEAAGNAHPDRDVFAGRILPHWPSSGIVHLDPVRHHFGVLFSLTSENEGPVNCQLAWGPNMAVRAHVFKSGVRFDPKFGPNGSDGYPMGSETELMERLDAAGHRAWFAERACVRHMIRSSQLDAQSVVQRAFRHGYGVGWRRQRNAGALRVFVSLVKAARGVCTARLRRTLMPFADPLLQDFREAWALGLARGALYEYRRARAILEFEEAFPERRATERAPVKD